jgi:hypothetical protein
VDSLILRDELAKMDDPFKQFASDILTDRT